MKWKFWKRDEDDLAAFEKELGLGGDRLGLEQERPTEENYDKLSKPGEPPVTFEPRSYEPQRTSQPQTSDISLVSAKLDTIKAMLDLINQRLNTIERNVEDKQKQKLW